MISPLSSIFFFRYQKISGKLKGSFTKLFVSVLWDKKFRQNRDSPSPSYAWKFSMKEFFWNTKVFSNKTFRYSEAKQFRRKIVIPVLCIKFFNTPNFLTHWREAHVYFRHCETKNFRRRNVIRPSIHKKFRYPHFSETLKRCPQKVSALWDQNFPTGKRDTPVFIHKTFWNRKFSQQHWDSLTKVFDTVRQKKFDGKVWNSYYA